MKKLMFAACAAAMIGGVEAAGYVDCFGVYDFAATLKTTKGVKANLKAKSNDCLDADGTYYVRKQATVKVAGLIWGCDCASIATPAPFTGFRYNGEVGPFDGSAFWNTTDKIGYDYFGDGEYNTLAWTILNRIDTTAKKTEGIWELKLAEADEEGNAVEAFNLVGAGFGTAAGELEGECGNSHVYIPSISGYVVGTRSYTCSELGGSTIQACQDPEGGSQIDLIWWELCDCGDGNDETIAYGSWSIKFNQSITNKGAKNAGMNEKVYTFPKYILPQMLAYDPDPEPTECDTLKEAVEAAEKAVEAVTYESLKAAVAEAEFAVANAKAAEYVAETNYNAKVVAWQNATNALAIARASTNQIWSITWVNSSRDIVTDDGAGTDSMIAKFAWLGGKYTINGATYGRTIFTKDVEKNATGTCTALNKAVETAERNVTTATYNRNTADSNLTTARVALANAQNAVAIAENRLANITYLQVEAQKALNKAVKAYEDAGCGLID